eukprot:826798-Amphidinium_carterae.2
MSKFVSLDSKMMHSDAFTAERFQPPLSLLLIVFSAHGWDDNPACLRTLLQQYRDGLSNTRVNEEIHKALREREVSKHMNRRMRSRAQYECMARSEPPSNTAIRCPTLIQVILRSLFRIWGTWLKQQTLP